MDLSQNKKTTLFIMMEPVHLYTRVIKLFITASRSGNIISANQLFNKQLLPNYLKRTDNFEFRSCYTCILLMLKHLNKSEETQMLDGSSDLTSKYQRGKYTFYFDNVSKQRSCTFYLPVGFSRPIHRTIITVVLFS